MKALCIALADGHESLEGVAVDRREYRFATKSEDVEAFRTTLSRMLCDHCSYRHTGVTRSSELSEKLSEQLTVLWYQGVAACWNREHYEMHNSRAKSSMPPPELTVPDCWNVDWKDYPVKRWAGPFLDSL